MCTYAHIQLWCWLDILLFLSILSMARLWYPFVGVPKPNCWGCPQLHSPTSTLHNSRYIHVCVGARAHTHTHTHTHTHNNVIVNPTSPTQQLEAHCQEDSRGSVRNVLRKPCVPVHLLTYQTCPATTLRPGSPRKFPSVTPA
jgi:hypothetical protein